MDLYLEICVYCVAVEFIDLGDLLRGMFLDASTISKYSWGLKTSRRLFITFCYFRCHSVQTFVQVTNDRQESVRHCFMKRVWCKYLCAFVVITYDLH
jgi:hypothetical protein